MGRASREKRERKQKEEYERSQHPDQETKENITTQKSAASVLSNPIAKKVVALKSRGAVVEALTQGSTDQVVRNLDELNTTGTVSGNKIKKALMSKAPGEMDKAIRKFRKEGKEITVDSLCAEAESTPSFVRMCENAGLPMSWFRELARERMEANGI